MPPSSLDPILSYFERFFIMIFIKEKIKFVKVLYASCIIDELYVFVYQV